METLNPNIFIRAGHSNDMNDICTNSGVQMDEYIDSINSFAMDAGIHRMHMYPNFSVGKLLGPQGYVAEIPLSKLFSSWIFAQPIFKVIAFFEIKYSSDILGFKKSNLVKDVIRKGIMLDTPFSPELGDTADSDFSPALGYDGCSVGIYKFEEKSGSEQVTRYFIGVQTELHHQLQKKLNDKLMGITYKNYELMNSRETHDSSNGPIEPMTFKSVLNDPLLTRMKQISRENAKRIADQFRELLNLSFKTAEPILLLSDMQSPTLMQDINYDKTSLSNIVKWYPISRPLYQDTYIQIVDEDENDVIVSNRFIAGPGVAGECVGAFAKAYNATEDPLKIGAFNIIQRRSTVYPTVECDFNTFRIQGDYAVIYNNCTCTVPSSRETAFGVIKQLSLPQGYQIFNTTISSNDRDKHSDEYMKWTNEHGNGFPVVSDLVKRTETNSTFNEETLDIFFSYNTGQSPSKIGQPIPAQLKYIPRDNPNDSSILAQDCYPPTFNVDSVQFLPEFVYLSPYPLFSSNNI
jgi:hypothetical protein